LSTKPRKLRIVVAMQLNGCVKERLLLRKICSPTTSGLPQVYLQLLEGTNNLKIFVTVYRKG
jgi:hypothetical protein